MKKILIFFCFISIISDCKKDEDNNVYYSYTYNHRVYISNEHISEISLMHGDSVSASSKYIFTDSMITEIEYYPVNTELKRTIYKLGINGFAESSYTIPEHYFLYSADTFFDSRLHYNYDNDNHMIRADLEIHPADSTKGSRSSIYYEDIYENGNWVKHIAVAQPFSLCEVTTNYEPSELKSKLDILNFTNGILGKTSKNLISTKTFIKPQSAECGRGNENIKSDYTYTLDNEGYVIQSKEVCQTNSYKDNRTYVTETINNYEIHTMKTQVLGTKERTTLSFIRH